MSIEQVVQSKYGAMATSGRSSNQQGVRAVAAAFGYSPEQLATIPAEANTGLPCATPPHFARPQPRAVVAHLGSGAAVGRWEEETAR